MICPFCNKKINEDSNFCKFCGKEIKDTNIYYNFNNENDINKSKKRSISDSIVLIISVSFIVLVILFIVVPDIYQRIISPSPARYTIENYETQEQSKPELEIIDSNFCWDEWGSKSVCGTIKNNGTYSKNMIMVNINLYDSQNNLIGNTVAVSGTLHSGTQWKFKAPILQSNASRFEIVNIND